ESDRFSGALWPGIYPADTPLADYEGDWEFSDLGADFSEFGESLVTVPFAGDSLGIIARRDNYRAYLYVSVDGEPARGLPQEYDDTDDVGRNGAYLVLTSPDYQPRVEAVPIAQGYTQGEIHMAHLAAERGWDQWALAGFAVGANVPTLGYDLAIGALLILTGAALLVGVRYLGELNWIGDVWRFALNQVNAGAQMALTAATAIAVWIGIALTLGGYVPAVIRDSGSIGSLIFTALTAGVFYFSPTLIATLIALLFLFVLLYSKPVYGPMLMVLFAPFYLLPRPLFDRAFSMVEVVALLTLAVWVLRTLAAWGDDDIPVDPPTPRQLWFESTPLDKAVVLFTGVAVVSLVWSDLVGVAVTELRMMVLEPAVLYLFLRTVPMEDGDRWRIVDALVIAGVVVAFAGFVQFGQDVLSTQGFVCLRSVTGTCNNAALFLGRIIPITAAVLLFNVERSERRWLYAAAGMIMLAAMALTTSRGGLLLGLPAGLGLVLIVWGGRRAAIAVGAGVALMFVSLIPLGRLVPRFNLLSQSNLFRIQLWQSTLRMLRDHPITGLGLDQFLYAYRGGYILPAAWQQPDLSHPHNVLLNYWVRLGIVGLVAGIWMQIAFWRMAIATQRRFKWFAPLSKRAMTVGLMGSMAAFLAHGMVDATHFVIDLSYVFFMTLGLMHQLHEESVPVGGQQPADL
ncbi:MAG: O-antigen ligase family protein, partial [Anaerolineae bacterium]